MGVIGRLMKKLGGGSGVAGIMRAFIEEASQMPTDQWAEAWGDITIGYLRWWLDLAGGSGTPFKDKAFSTGDVGRKEARWFRLRRREHERILANLDGRDAATFGPHDPDCVRALAAAMTTRTADLVAAKGVKTTWANEWRYYSEALEQFEVRPHHPIPPSFRGTFPSDAEDF